MHLSAVADVENREFLPRLHAWVPRFSFHLIGEAV